MRRFKRILLGLAVVLILIQFIQPARNKNSGMSLNDITKKINIPESVGKLLETVCYDCHSNNTDYPWYSRVQPFGWLLAKHIREGKKELNFNEFGSYSQRRQISKMDAIKNSVQDRTMPLRSYKLLHRNARLSKEERDIIIEWAERTEDSLRLNN